MKIETDSNSSSFNISSLNQSRFGLFCYGFGAYNIQYRRGYGYPAGQRFAKLYYNFEVEPNPIALYPGKQDSLSIRGEFYYPENVPQLQVDYTNPSPTSLVMQLNDSLIEYPDSVTILKIALIDVPVNLDTLFPIDISVLPTDENNSIQLNSFTTNAMIYDYRAEIPDTIISPRGISNEFAVDFTFSDTMASEITKGLQNIHVEFDIDSRFEEQIILVPEKKTFNKHVFQYIIKSTIDTSEEIVVEARIYTDSDNVYLEKKDTIIFKPTELKYQLYFTEEEYESFAGFPDTAYLKFLPGEIDTVDESISIDFDYNGNEVWFDTIYFTNSTLSDPNDSVGVIFQLDPNVPISDSAIIEIKINGESNVSLSTNSTDLIIINRKINYQLKFQNTVDSFMFYLTPVEPDTSIVDYEMIFPDSLFDIIHLTDTVLKCSDCAKKTGFVNNRDILDNRFNSYVNYEIIVSKHTRPPSEIYIDIFGESFYNKAKDTLHIKVIPLTYRIYPYDSIYHSAAYRGFEKDLSIYTHGSPKFQGVVRYSIENEAELLSTTFEQLQLSPDSLYFNGQDNIQLGEINLKYEYKKDYYNSNPDTIMIRTECDQISFAEIINKNVELTGMLPQYDLVFQPKICSLYQKMSQSVDLQFYPSEFIIDGELTENVLDEQVFIELDSSRIDFSIFDFVQLGDSVLSAFNSMTTVSFQLSENAAEETIYRIFVKGVSEKSNVELFDSVDIFVKKIEFSIQADKEELLLVPQLIKPGDYDTISIQLDLVEQFDDNVALSFSANSPYVEGVFIGPDTLSQNNSNTQIEISLSNYDQLNDQFSASINAELVNYERLPFSRLIHVFPLSYYLETVEDSLHSFAGLQDSCFFEIHKTARFEEELNYEIDLSGTDDLFQMAEVDLTHQKMNYVLNPQLDNYQTYPFSIQFNSAENHLQDTVFYSVMKDAPVYQLWSDSSVYDVYRNYSQSIDFHLTADHHIEMLDLSLSLSDTGKFVDYSLSPLVIDSLSSQTTLDFFLDNATLIGDSITVYVQADGRSTLESSSCSILLRIKNDDYSLTTQNDTIYAKIFREYTETLSLNILGDFQQDVSLTVESPENQNFDVLSLEQYFLNQSVQETGINFKLNENALSGKTYEIVISGTSSINQQQRQKSLYVYVDSDPVEVYPLMFTPNGDGINDEVLIYVFEDIVVNELEFRVFNIRGREIFGKKVVNQRGLVWDGRTEQKNQANLGAYPFWIKINGNVRKKGVITLVR